MTTWGLAAGYFAPGALLGGLLGWFIIYPVNFVLGALFRGFNYLFDSMTALYGWTVGKALRLSFLVLVCYGVLLGLTYWTFSKAPTGFIPQQDQGRLIVSIQLPDSASLQRTQDALAEIDRITRETPGVAHTVGIAGMSFLLQANSPNFASMFVVLDPFEQRRSAGRSDVAIMANLQKAWNAQSKDSAKDAVVVVRGSSPIPGLGVAGGFKVIVEDRGGLGLDALQDQTEKLVRRLQYKAYKLTDKSLTVLRADGMPDSALTKLEPMVNKEYDVQETFLHALGDVLDKAELTRFQKQLLTQSRIPSGLNGVNTQFRSNTPQLYLDIDRAKVASVGVSLDDVNQTLDVYLGSLYVNSYNEFGRHWQVTLQAEGEYRNRIEQLNLFKVRNNKGQMVPLGTLVTAREVGGPISITRYNLYNSASISGNILGVSSGDAIKFIDETSAESLPITMKAEWTEVMFMQLRAGNTAMYIFLLSIFCVFLALSALYESWALPLAVILVVPLCLLCSVSGVLLTNRDVNIFVQIGLVVLVGLACKNAILVVEYAKQKHEEGRSIFTATKEASKLRLRPILMTSFAFIFGVTPLVVASGAGAEMRRSLGIAVFSGMLGVTLFGIFLTPVFFYVIQGIGTTRLFQSAATRWIGSSLVGGFSGFGIGYLLGLLGVVHFVWGPLVGACGGVLVVLAVLEVKRRIMPLGVAIDKETRVTRRQGQNKESLEDPRSVATLLALVLLAAFSGQMEVSTVLARFFVDRPIFATVISVVIVLAGGVAVAWLPIAQYPEVTPPTVQVTALYPGANALTVRDTVAAPIEEQVSGVEGMMYMSSRCTNDGAYNLTVTFKLGTDSDMAQVLVQNRVSLALPVIPALVQNEGINVKKMSPSTMMIVNLISPHATYDDIYLSNYATTMVKDELGRLPGVAGITYLGQRDYSLRIWLDADRMASLGLNGMDVVTAIAQQNVQVAAGAIGQQPVPKGQQFQLTINTQGRLAQPEEFADIILKVGSGSQTSAAASQGSPATMGAATTSANTGNPSSQAIGIVRVRDVVTKNPDGSPKVELGSQQYDQSCTLDGKPSVALSIFQLPGTNALDTATGVYAKMKELKTRFPDGLDYKIVYDTTPFIRESVYEVFYTLRDAVILVAIVVLVFLQDWRAMILPMIDVPVSLIGTFAVMAMMGFTLNNLTLFGLVLAIGIVVDDAIVVLENIERLIATGLDSRTAATIKAMEEDYRSGLCHYPRA